MVPETAAPEASGSLGALYKGYKDVGDILDKELHKYYDSYKDWSGINKEWLEEHAPAVNRFAEFVSSAADTPGVDLILPQTGLVNPKLLVSKLQSKGLITAYRGTEYNYPVIGKGSNFFATNPNYINKQFSIGKDIFEPGMKVGKFKIDTEKFFNPFNPSDREKLIARMEELNPGSITDKKLFDKNLDSGNWLLIEDAMSYVKPNRRLGNILEDLGYEGSFLVEDIAGKPYVNLVAFNSYKIKPGW